MGVPAIPRMQVRPDIVGGQLFKSVPVALRCSQLELAAVRRGSKPAALLCLTTDQIVSSGAYLRALGLRFVVASNPPSSFLQIALPERMHLRVEPRVRLYVARTDHAARSLAECEVQSDFSRLGALLGYPECCIAAAVARDRDVRDRLFDVERQTNLIYATLEASKSLNFACNILLRDSPVCQFGPSSLVSHYPCSFDCCKTADLARAFYDILADEWPLWSLQLVELLQSPLILWSDRWWPPHFWDEMAGVVQLGGTVDSSSRRISGGWSLPIGLGRTPGGALVADAIEIQIKEDATVFRLSHREHVISHAAAGSPVLLDWRRGHIERSCERQPSGISPT